MSKALHRLARLRASLQRQALHNLGVAEQSLQHAESAFCEMQEELRAQAAASSLTAPMLKLLESTASLAADAVVIAECSREETSEEARDRTVEMRQVEKLLAKAEADRRRLARQREQRQTDSWVHHRWGSK